MSTEARAVVERLARALDEDDYETAGPLIDHACKYEIGDELIVGSERIVGSYSDNSAWARAAFDELIFESAVHSVDGPTVTITFADVLRHGGREHRHTCRQVFTVGAGGLVEHIRHEDIPGEPEAARAFMDACGIVRP